MSITKLPTRDERYDARVQACNRELGAVIDRMTNRHDAFVITSVLILHLGAAMKVMRRNGMAKHAAGVVIRLWRESTPT